MSLSSLFTSSIKSYTHVQTAPSVSWLVAHGLGKRPIIDVYINVENTPTKILPLNVVHQDENTALITWSSPQAGRAVCVSSNNGV